MICLQAYREQMRTMGEVVRWFKALPAYDATHIASTSATAGKRYVEQSLAATVRVLAREQQQEYMHPDFGLLRIGDMILTCLADELQIGFEDEIVLPGRTDEAREAVTRAASGNDALLERFTVALLSVSDAARTYVIGTASVGDCYLSSGAVAWRTGAAHKPNTGAVYTVQYSFNPVYWHTSGKARAPRPIPMTNDQTPQQVALTKKLAGTV
jgi:hypothetical protein